MIRGGQGRDEREMLRDAAVFLLAILLLIAVFAIGVLLA